MFNITNVDFTDHCSYLLFIYFIFIMKSTYELHFLFFGCYRCCSRCCCSCSWCYSLLLFLSFFCLFFFFFLLLLLFFLLKISFGGVEGEWPNIFGYYNPFQGLGKGNGLGRGGGYQTVFEI